jgi:hypothetical protein
MGRVHKLLLRDRGLDARFFDSAFARFPSQFRRFVLQGAVVRSCAWLVLCSSILKLLSSELC